MAREKKGKPATARAARGLRASVKPKKPRAKNLSQKKRSRATAATRAPKRVIARAKGAKLTHPVLLIGSVPLPDTKTVLGAIAGTFGRDIKRVPDGETGPRSKFITWQAPVLAQAEQFHMQPLGPQSEWGAHGEWPPRILRLKPDASGAPQFGPTGYADAALASYPEFARLKSAGRFGADARFQVGLPTALGVLGVFMEPAGQALAEPAYRARLVEDVERISAAIPHRELTIQWDVPEELAVWDGYSSTYLADPKPDIVGRTIDLMDRVPAGVELGMHLCYGDISHQHRQEPDPDVMVAFTNALVARLRRKLDYVHIPVPRNWTEPRHYAKFAELRLDPECEVYLGLVHSTDGLEGARQRLTAAHAHLRRFGVATSCGLGRRPPEILAGLFALHRDISRLPAR
jgi:hypothetical protein